MLSSATSLERSLSTTAVTLMKSFNDDNDDDDDSMVRDVVVRKFTQPLHFKIIISTVQYCTVS